MLKFVFRLCSRAENSHDYALTELQVNLRLKSIAKKLEILISKTREKKKKIAIRTFRLNVYEDDLNFIRVIVNEKSMSVFMISGVRKAIGNLIHAFLL